MYEHAENPRAALHNAHYGTRRGAPVIALAVVVGFLAGLLGAAVALYAIALRVRHLEDRSDQGDRAMCHAWTRIIELEVGAGTYRKPRLHILPPENEGGDDA